GGAGNDIIIGNGNTLISYVHATAAGAGDLAAPRPHGQTGSASGGSPGGQENIKGGVTNARGSDFVDTPLGSNNNGVYKINGRGGLDRAAYSSFVDDSVTAGVTISLAAGTVIGDASVGTDMLRSIEFIRGSNFVDSYDATNFGQTGTANMPSNGNTLNEFE